MDQRSFKVRIKIVVYPWSASCLTLISACCISGTTIASWAPAFNCLSGKRAVMVACMIAPLAAETILDEGPVTSKPSADWIKLLVAAESNNGCLMASSMTSFSARQYVLVAFLFSIRRANRRANFERGRGLSDDSTFECVGLFLSMLLISLGGSMMGGEMGPVATR